MKTNSKLLFIAFVTLLAFSCKKDPVKPNESELITTIKLTLVDSASPSNTYTFLWKDGDGVGGASPIIDSIKLPIGKTYFATLLLLDERNASAVDTISNEIEEEDNEHQFFYQSTPADVLTNFNYLSFDGNGLPLGSDFKFRTKASAANGTLRVSLVHEPNKFAAGVSSGDITNAGGETDIETDFPVKLF